MDESSSSFYIESLKDEMQKQRVWEEKQAKLKRVESLNKELKSVRKGRISLKELVQQRSTIMEETEEETAGEKRSSSLPKVFRDVAQT